MILNSGPLFCTVLLLAVPVVAELLFFIITKARKQRYDVCFVSFHFRKLSANLSY